MINKPRGTVDLFGQKQREYGALKLIIRNIMDLYNYNEVETPIFESLDLFKRAVGEETDIVAKEMFVFEDKKGRQMALRPEGTAPTVRMVVENKLYIPENLPLKLFYIGPMFRYERPQNGRQRQFNQLGVEVYGSNDFMTDVEIITLGVNLVKQLGISKIACHINYLVSGDNRKKYINDLKTFLMNKNLCDDCTVRFEKNPLRVLDCKVDKNLLNDAIDMQDYLTDEEKGNFNNILDSLKSLEVECVVDKLLVRGLDYYTGTVFEIISTDESIGAQSTILGGGRYNKLVKELDGPELPAVGFGLGIERTLISLENAGITLANEKKLDAYIVSVSEKAKKASLLVSGILRNSGITCEINHLNKSMKGVFKQLERIKTTNLIVIGDDELKNNYLTIKNQETKNEEKVSFDKIVEYFK